MLFRTWDDDDIVFIIEQRAWRIGLELFDVLSISEIQNWSIVEQDLHFIK